MKFRKLGDSGVDMSLIGLRTMTWGEQNTESEAHEQIDYALAQGVNLIDAAEMYPVPPRPENAGPHGAVHRHVAREKSGQACRYRARDQDRRAGASAAQSAARATSSTARISTRRSIRASSAFKRITAICINCTGPTAAR